MTGADPEVRQRLRDSLALTVRVERLLFELDKHVTELRATIEELVDEERTDAEAAGNG